MIDREEIESKATEFEIYSAMYRESIFFGWLSKNKEHQAYPCLCEFVEGGYDRVRGDLKKGTFIILDLLDEIRPAPVILGKAIARHCVGTYGTPIPTSIKAMLGQKTYDELIQSGTGK